MEDDADNWIHIGTIANGLAARLVAARDKISETARSGGLTGSEAADARQDAERRTQGERLKGVGAAFWRHRPGVDRFGKSKTADGSKHERGGCPLGAGTRAAAGVADGLGECSTLEIRVTPARGGRCAARPTTGMPHASVVGPACPPVENPQRVVIEALHGSEA